MTQNSLVYALVVLCLILFETQPTIQAPSKFIEPISHPFNVIYFDNAHRRHEFIFNTTNALTNTSLSFDSNGTTLVGSGCLGYHACHIIDGNLSNGYTLDADKLLSNGDDGQKILGYFKSHRSSKDNTFELTTDDDCPQGRHLNIYTYCNTHWHPPMHLHTWKCRETFEWHSPFACGNDTWLNQEEIPCYTYNGENKLVNLIPLIKTDGSSYQVDTSAYPDMKNFHINVCNEANKECGPGVASCHTKKQNGIIEAGYSNSATILWNSLENAAEITYLGQHSPLRGDNQKTTIRFICPTEIRPISKPKLAYSGPSVNVVEWYTQYACPESNTTSTATSCSLRLDHYGINVNIKDLTNDLDDIEVSGIRIGGSDWKMKLGICKGLPNFSCGGKQVSTGAACLFPEGEVDLAQNKSKIVGSIIQSTIKLSDNTIIMEYPTLETCYSPNESYSSMGSQSTAQKLSTKIEFSCDPTFDDSSAKPKFIGFQDCSYVFSWPSRQLCREIALSHECSVKVSEDYSLDLTELYRSPKDDPWKVRAPSKKQHPLDISLNVCGLLHGKDFKNLCNQSSSICYVDSMNKSHNLGIYHNATYNSTTETIELLYLGGHLLDKSDNMTSPGTRVRSIVRLTCDHSGGKEQPVINTLVDTELYMFSWRTPAACIKHKPTEVSDLARPAVEQIEKPSMKPKETNSNSSQIENAEEPIKDAEISKTNHDDPTGKDLHEKTVNDANDINNSQQSESQHQDSLKNQEFPLHPSKLDTSSDRESNRFHKMIMISLIFTSFISCIVVIVYLNSKTRLTRPLNHFRSRNQQTVPYRRVVDEYGENEDL